MTDRLRVPGEWEPHRRTWMLWPQRPDNWRQCGWPAQQAFLAVARAIARFEPVVMGAAQPFASLLPDILAQDQNISVVALPSDDAWMRDVGPTWAFQEGRGLVGIDWPFNAWGGLTNGLYAHWDQDDQVAQRVLSRTGHPRQRASLVMEGGALHFDGAGTLLTTRECLLDAGRNPGLSQAEIQDELKSLLAVDQILWLPYGLAQDETKGHVDNCAAFVRPGELVLAWTDDPGHPDYRRCRENMDYLSAQVDAQGRELKIHKLVLPAQKTLPHSLAQEIYPAAGSQPRSGGAPLAASYCNFYLCNGGLVVPVFDDPADAAAVRQLAPLFPERDILAVPSLEILYGGGNIHCITQQEPAA